MVLANSGVDIAHDTYYYVAARFHYVFKYRCGFYNVRGILFLDWYVNLLSISQTGGGNVKTFE